MKSLKNKNVFIIQVKAQIFGKTSAQPHTK